MTKGELRVTEDLALSGQGHRKRLKERFDVNGFEGFSNHEIIEMLLFFTIPQRDTKPLAKTLLQAFGSIPAIFAAKRETLLEIKGLGPESARFIHLIKSLGELALKTRLYESEVNLSSISDLVTYLKGSMANLHEEEFRVVYVNHANQVIKDETLSKGTEDQTAVYPRQVMKRALALHATGLFVAHNHPTGLLRPSQADRDITRNLQAAAATLEIRFLDHVIIGREGTGYFSFRENGLIR